jgi:glycosyltransferase involved in cell wall biosynthesis
MISLVTTVLNDYQGCLAFFEQMDTQTSLPDEIVIVDGGSTDGTWEFLQAYQPKKHYKLNVFQEKGCNVAKGRNLAIAAAHHEIIVSTDIGCFWDPQWLEELVNPLLEDSQIEAVMGSWRVRWEDLKGGWAKVEYALLNQPELIATPKSHASSRSIAYRKTLWDKMNGYPEDLTLAGDDMVFALQLHQTTDAVASAPIPRCYWERPIQLKSFCKEAHRNFRGGGEAGIWLNYGLLIGSRLLVELLLPIAGLLWVLFFSPKWLGIIAISLGFFSIAQRISKLLPAIARLREAVPHINGFWQILVFEYLTKIYSILGYWSGFFRGIQHCQECRQRLKQN